MNLVERNKTRKLIAKKWRFPLSNECYQVIFDIMLRNKVEKYSDLAIIAIKKKHLNKARNYTRLSASFAFLLNSDLLIE